MTLMCPLIIIIAFKNVPFSFDNIYYNLHVELYHVEYSQHSLRKFQAQRFNIYCRIVQFYFLHEHEVEN